MIILDISPKNAKQFDELVDFLGEIIAACHSLGIDPVLSGSLAVLAHTQDQTLSVNDIDLACSEDDFPHIIEALSNTGIECRRKEWHVLQVWKAGLKIEFDSMEHWMRGIPEDYDTLQLDGLRLRMLRAADLRELYRRGMVDTADQTDAGNRSKHQALRAKYNMLTRVVSS